MNCADFEKLMDAYLDGELSGSLRLEFDAHRLRCRRCQLTMVMMESVGNVVASDRHTPTLSDDFTEQVMSKIDRRRPLSLRLRSKRVALVAGALFQAAAIFYLAVMLPSQQSPPPQIEPQADSAVVLSPPVIGGDATMDRKALYDYIVSRVEDAGANWATDLSRMAGYVSALSVPDNIARASAGLEEANPWGVFLRALLPSEPTDAETPPATANQYLL